METQPSGPGQVCLQLGVQVLWHSAFMTLVDRAATASRLRHTKLFDRSHSI